MGKRTPHGQRKRLESGYGAFPGGDPRRFSPDPECSTDAEREAHRLACGAWDRGDKWRVPSAHEYTGGPCDALTAIDGVVAHVTETRFGLGGYEFKIPVVPRWRRRIEAHEARNRLAIDWPEGTFSIAELMR